MSEREYHDAHYAGEAAAIFGGPLFARVHDRVARDFLVRTGAGKSHRLLSLGCGNGLLERRLAPYLGEIVGVDISPVAIAQAAATRLPNLSFSVSAATADDLGRFGRFDIVAGFAFLHHLDDAALAMTLRAARAVLLPGGVWYSADPSRRRLVRLFAPLVRSAYDRHHSPDERELDPPSLIRLASEAGFARPRIVYTDFFLGPLAWLAPGTPSYLAAGLEALDNAALALPFVRTFASSFSLSATVP